MLRYTAITVTKGTDCDPKTWASALPSGKTIALSMKERKMTQAAAKKSVIKHFKKYGYNVNGVELEFVTTLDKLPTRV